MNGNSNIEKGWLGFLPREGLPGYILCTCARLSFCDLGYMFTCYAFHGSICALMFKQS